MPDVQKKNMILCHLGMLELLRCPLWDCAADRRCPPGARAPDDVSRGAEWTKDRGIRAEVVGCGREDGRGRETRENGRRRSRFAGKPEPVKRTKLKP